MFIAETETTGPVVRVWFEDCTPLSIMRVAEEARNHLGTDALCEVVEHNSGCSAEVIFERGDL